jgi:hypothetical protein
LWPDDLLHVLIVSGKKVPVASKEALLLYRQQHKSVVEAYQNYLQQC